MVWSVQSSTAGGGLTRAGRKRVCFQLQFDPTNLPQYIEDHRAVWPEMQQALVNCGWHNYSLFYRPDGYAIGYFETDVSFETACQRMDETSINAKWQAAMSKYTPSGNTPLLGAAELQHYFYLGEDTLDNVDVAFDGIFATHRALAAFALGVCCGLALARCGLKA